MRCGYTLAVLALLVVCVLIVKSATPTKRWRHRCGKPPSGDRTVNPVMPDRVYYRYERALYRCANGMKLTGQMDNNVRTFSLKCRRGRRWEKPVPKCEPIVACGSPPIGSNTVPVPSDLTLTYPGYYKYSCLPNYYTEDPVVVVCKPDGSLSMEEGPDCYAVTCDAPANGTNTMDVEVGPVYSVSDRYVYECVEYYIPAADCTSLVTICMSDGSWSAQPSMCEPEFPLTGCEGQEITCLSTCDTTSHFFLSLRYDTVNVTVIGEVTSGTVAEIRDGGTVPMVTVFSNGTDYPALIYDMASGKCITEVRVYNRDTLVEDFDVMVTATPDASIMDENLVCQTVDSESWFGFKSFTCSETMFGRFVILRSRSVQFSLSEAYILGCSGCV